MRQSRLLLALLLVPPAALHAADAPKPPYDIFPPAEAPYYRVRYDASTKPGELTFAVNYTVSVHGPRVTCAQVRWLSSNKVPAGKRRITALIC